MATIETTTTTTLQVDKPALFMNTEESKFELKNSCARNSLLAAMAFAEKLQRKQASSKRTSPLTLGLSEDLFWDHKRQVWRNGAEEKLSTSSAADDVADEVDDTTTTDVDVKALEEHAAAEQAEKAEKEDEVVDDLDLESLKGFARKWRRRSSKEGGLSLETSSLSTSTSSTASSYSSSSTASSRLRTPLSSLEVTPMPSAMASAMPSAVQSRAPSPPMTRVSSATPSRTPSRRPSRDFTFNSTPSRAQSAAPSRVASRDASRTTSPVHARPPLLTPSSTPLMSSRSIGLPATAHPYSIYTDASRMSAALSSSNHNHHKQQSSLAIPPSPKAAAAARQRAATLSTLLDKQLDFERRLEEEKARWRQELEQQQQMDGSTQPAAPPQPQALDERPSPLAAASAAATRAKAAIKEAPLYTNLPPSKAALPKVVSPKPLAQKRLVFEEGVQGWRMIEI